MERDSGYETADQRVELLKLRQWVKDGLCSSVVVYNTDRLSREPTELVSLWSEFKRHHCTVHFLLAPTEDSNIGKAMLFIRGLGHEIEWLSIRERTSRARNGIRDSGRRVGHGGPRYGYKWVRDQGGDIVPSRAWEIDEPAAAVVRLIFGFAAEGWSGRKIATELNRRGIPSISSYRGLKFRDGRSVPWNASTVRPIIRDQIYKGIAYANRFRNPSRKKTIAVPREEWVHLGNSPTPPIVDPSLWEAANAGMRSNDLIGERTRHARAAGTRNDKHFYIFRGIIFCGACGRPLVVTRAVNGTKQETYYRCDHNRKMRDSGQDFVPCLGKAVNERYIADAVWEAVVGILTTDGVIEREAERLRLERPGEAVLRDSLAAARSEIQTVDRRLRNLVSTLAEEDDATLRALVREKILALKTERSGHESRADALVTRLRAYDEINERCDRLQKCADEIRRGMTDPSKLTPRQRRDAMDGLRCEVFADGTEIVVRINVGVVESLTPDEEFAVQKTTTRSSSPNRKQLSLGWPVSVPTG
jgi:DNA invertase Pin-like site-specific DNA recombinase